MPAMVAPPAPPPDVRSVVSKSPNGTARTMMVSPGLAASYLSMAASSCATVSGPQWVRKEISAAWLCAVPAKSSAPRSEEHTSELQSRENLVCRLLLEKKKRRSERIYSEK